LSLLRDSESTFDPNLFSLGFYWIVDEKGSHHFVCFGRKFWPIVSHKPRPFDIEIGN
jgi:hypothetical protein